MVEQQTRFLHVQKGFEKELGDAARGGRRRKGEAAGIKRCCEKYARRDIDMAIATTVGGINSRGVLFDINVVGFRDGMNHERISLVIT